MHSFEAFLFYKLSQKYLGMVESVFLTRVRPKTSRFLHCFVFLYETFLFWDKFKDKNLDGSMIF
ncbi:hypothetical protein LEP1GSC161_3302 [Leptospira santarosai str. CBC1416]|uniref:Uncharacterized protein n=1 Tax=Leptospira santarosai str. CBC1416 TaxID=1193059 RepID=M6VZ70_9LEPT|nr:hypothetical protein LEP1GSC161_3302 [Leptospira santarosai str. CBC1416]